MTTNCPSTVRHGTWWAAKRYGCQCPEAETDRARRDRESNARRAYIRGSRRNLYFRDRSYVDEVAVERALDGDLSRPLTVAERAAAIDRLDSYGLSASAIAIRLGVTARTVQRRRHRRATTSERTAA